MLFAEVDMLKIAKKGNYFHVIFDKEVGKWLVKEVGKTELKLTLDSKYDAIDKAKKLRDAVLYGHIIIHNENGKFEALR